MHDRRAGLGNVAPPGFRMKAVELDDATGGQDHRGGRHRERVHVKQRQRRDQPLLGLAQRAQAAFGDIALPYVEKVEVAQQAALRLAGGARGIEQGALACIARLGSGRKIPVEHFSGDDQACFAMAQDVFQFRCTVVGIDRHHGCADRVEGEKVQQELGAVLEAQRDTVPGAVAARAVTCGDIRHPVERRGVAQLQLFRQHLQEWPGAVLTGSLLERRKDRRHCADGKMPRVVRTTGGGHVEEDFCPSARAKIFLDMASSRCPNDARHLTIRTVTTVFSAFEQTARVHGARPFLQVLPEQLQLSYTAALDRVTDIAARYRARGYGAGHRVALRLENRAEFLLHFLALNSIGAAVVPINPDYRAAELDYILGHCEASLVVTGEMLDGDFPPAPKPGDASECALLYTSGTTGKPKGCLLSNFYFLNLGQRYVAEGGQPFGLPVVPEV